MNDRCKLIMETIALVRSRKARPDIERICKTMQRNHGVDPKETERWLDILCDRGVVARRPFKGAVSYRIVADEKAGAAKATARYHRNARRIAKAVAELDPHGLGVSFNAIERYISTHWQLTCSILSLRVRLRSALRDGVEEGRFVKTSNGSYKLGSTQTGIEEVTEEDTNEDVNDDNGDELLCDYCQLSADRNPLGEPEELLICKDCGNKAHPSCLSYSTELVEQIRADDSWQCIDCKACTICDGTGDPDSLLFCDACDKGYHMNCHTPKLDQMPSGKWMCSLCAIKRAQNETNGVYIIEDDNTITGIENNSNGQSTAVISSSGPPTMVQIQRTSQLQKGNASSQNATSRSKVPPIRPRPGSSQFKQPMIALGSPNTNQFRPSISVMTTSHRMVNSPQVTLNPSAYPVPLTAQVINTRLPLHASPQSFKITQGSFSQEGHSYLREDILRNLPSDVADWSVADVCYYVKSHGFPGESKLFEEQEVDGKALLLMSRNDVLTGLRLKLGPALKIYHLHISKLQTRTDFIGV